MKPTTASLAILLLLAAMPGPSGAHGLGVSYSSLVANRDKLVVEVRVQAHDVLAVLGANPYADAATEVPARRTEILQYVRGRYEVTLDGKPLARAAERLRFLPDGAGWCAVDVEFHAPGEALMLALKSSLMLEIDPAHAHLAKLTRADGRMEERVLKAGHPGDWPLSGEVSTLGSDLRRFMLLGVEHIFLGYDHILFLLALLLLAGGFLDLVKIVTSFTAAHTLTLILATLDVVHLDPRVTETVIAASIVYVALENFFLRDARRRWKLTFAFGLIHGFGFSSVLKELGLPSSGIVACLLSFNAGVELGQLTIVAIAYPLLRRLARWNHFELVIRQGGSAAILFAGLYWFFERVFAP